MNNSRRMSRGEPVGDLNRDVQEFSRCIHRRDRRSLHELHHQVIRPHVVKLADIIVIERGDRPRLTLKAFRKRFFGLLDGNHAVEARVASFVHLSHATSADWIQNLVWAETRSGRKGHRSRILLQIESRTDWHDHQSNRSASLQHGTGFRPRISNGESRRCERHGGGAYGPTYQVDVQSHSVPVLMIQLISTQCAWERSWWHTTASLEM